MRNMSPIACMSGLYRGYIVTASRDKRKGVRSSCPADDGGREWTSETKSPAQYRKDFFARVKSARVMSGMAPEEIAKELGVKRNTYLTWERRTLMPHDKLIAFCEITRTDFYFLMTGTPFDLGKALPRARHSA